MPPGLQRVKAAEPAGEQPAPRLGPDVGGWRHSKIRHLVLLFDSGKQEAAYREWLDSPASYAAFGRWYDERHEE
jgi:hypothetical protein